jgi:hypothetical protein
LLLTLTAAAMTGEIIRFSTACIFGQAAAHALRHRDHYTAIVEAYRIAAPAWSRLAARILPFAQCAAGALLIMPVHRSLGPMLGLFLMALFTAAIAINVRRGRLHIDCGCGGAEGQRLSSGLVVRNLLLCAMLGFALVAPKPDGINAAFVIGVAGASAFLVILYFAANQLLANAQARTA